MRTFCSITAFVVCLLLPPRAVAQVSTASEVKAMVQHFHRLNYLVVTPNGPEDGGDFGPNTPGTKTSGLQEAFNRAHEEVKDLYIVGGGLNDTTRKSVGYQLQETLHLPWMHNFRLDGGEYFLAYGGETGDAVVIDSQMNCRLKFGLVVAQKSNGAVVRIAPTSKGPDGFSCCVANSFEFNGMVGAGDVWGKSSDQKSTGLILDPTGGGISGNRISILEINGCRRGIYLMPGAGNNTIEAEWIHLTNLGIQIGSPQEIEVSGNRIRAGISGDIRNTTGVQVFGHHNSLWVDVFNVDPGRALVLEAPAHDNLIVSANLAGGFANHAEKPTNRLIAPPELLTVKTPPFPASGKEIVNDNLCLVEVCILTPGKVSQWTESVSQGKRHSFSGGLAAGQSFLLNPGDKVQFRYEEAPTWFWKGL